MTPTDGVAARPRLPGELSVAGPYHIIPRGVFSVPREPIPIGVNDLRPRGAQTDDPTQSYALDGHFLADAALARTDTPLDVEVADPVGALEHTVVVL